MKNRKDGMYKLRRSLRSAEKTMDHAIRRFKERYGREMDKEQLLAIRELAIRGKTQKCGVKKWGEVHVLKIGMELIAFVLRADTKEIATFLPKSVIPKQCLLAATSNS